MGGTSGLDFLIGFLVSLLSSIMNAAGLNLLKLDHVRNSARPVELQRNECARPLWHIGLGLYILSQLAGSTIALNFLKTQWVAPLGSIALIFNFIFAKILVGTRITKKDVYGTIIVMASVIWIVVFGAMNDGGDIEDKLTLADLKLLFSRFVFILYFSILNIITFGFLFLGMYAYWAISLDDDASGQIRKRMKKRLTNLLGTNRFARASGLNFDDLDDHESGAGTGVGDVDRISGLETAEQKDQRLKKVVAMIMAGCGGMLASQTLLLAKSGVKLITSTFSGNNQFTDYLSYFILFVLVVTAVLQVYCLNTGLKLYDSVLVVPMFYGFYTAFGLINSVIYLDQLKTYEPWVLLLVLLGIAALIYGVKMLSAPKPDPSQAEAMSSLEGRGGRYNDDDDDDEMMMDDSHRRRAGASGRVSQDLERSTSRGSMFTKSKGPLGSSADSSHSTTTTTHGILSEDRQELARSGSRMGRSGKTHGGNGGGGGDDTGMDTGNGDKEEGGRSRSNKLAGILKFGKNKRDKHKQGSALPAMDTKAGTMAARGGPMYLNGTGPSKNLQRTSVYSKASMQSDPFKTPKDSQSLRGELTGELEIVGLEPSPSLDPVDMPNSHQALILDQDDLFEEPTHILVDTASEDEGEEGSQESNIRGQAALATAAAMLAAKQQQQQEKRRQQENEQQSQSSRSQQHYTLQDPTTPSSPSRPLSLIESAIGNPFRSAYETRVGNGSPPPLTTAMAITTPPPLMSPSQFKAHLTGASGGGKSPLKPSPMQPQSSTHESGTTTTATTATGSGRPASARWSTGNHLTMDKAFEDLNPFKVLRGSSHQHHASESSRRNSLISDGSFLSGPSSPRQHPSATFSPGVPSSSSFSSSAASPQPPLLPDSGTVVTTAAATTAAGSSTTFSSNPPSSASQNAFNSKSRSASHRRQDSFTGLPSTFDVPGRKKRHSMLFGVPGEGPHSPSTAASPQSFGEGSPVPGSASSSGASSPSQHHRALSTSSRGGSAPALGQSASSSTAATGRAGDRTSASHMYRDHFFTGVPGSPNAETAHG